MITKVADMKAAGEYIQSIRDSGKVVAFGVGSIYSEDVTVITRDAYRDNAYVLYHRKPVAERKYSDDVEYTEIVRW